MQSSVLSAVHFDPDRRVLEVKFHSGRLYHYFDVPKDVYDALLAAPSLGSYFNKVIRPRFRCELVG